MAVLSAELRESLKKPLGRAGSLDRLMPLVKGRKIISVGDQATYSLLRMGIRPHLSAFDLMMRRRPVSREVREMLEKEYPSPKTFKNPAGTISEELFLAAPSLMRMGGAIFIEGEEDLVAIPFIFFLEKDYVVIYGQPREGCVLVSSTSSGRRKIRKIAEALGLVASLRD